MSGEKSPPRTVDQVSSLAVRRRYFHGPGKRGSPLHKCWQVGHIRRGWARCPSMKAGTFQGFSAFGSLSKPKGLVRPADEYFELIPSGSERGTRVGLSNVDSFGISRIGPAKPIIKGRPFEIGLIARINAYGKEHPQAIGEKSPIESWLARHNPSACLRRRLDPNTGVLSSPICPYDRCTCCCRRRIRRFPSRA